jgi:predicted branched-subunit amino acid permease
MLPLLVGIVPFALVFGMSARALGWHPWETQALSMLLAAGGAQLAVLSLSAAGASGPVIVAVVALLNLRYALYGMALARWLPPDEPPPRPLLAAVLSDESFGLATREALAGRPSAAFLWGASITLYVVLALGTLAGTLLGAWLPDPRALGLDVVFPLVFLALLLLTARDGRDWLVAGASAVVAVGLRQVTDGGTALLGATVGTAVVVLANRTLANRRLLWEALVAEAAGGRGGALPPVGTTRGRATRRRGTRACRLSFAASDPYGASALRHTGDGVTRGPRRPPAR